MSSSLFLLTALFNVLLICSAVDDDTSRIVGGIPAAKGQFPFMAGIRRRPGKTPTCGGSIINAKFVLTAAHCVYRANNKKLEVVLGDHDVLKPKEEGEMVKRICRVHVHPYYGGASPVNHDVALLELCRPIKKFTAFVQPIALWDTFKEVKRGQSATVAGWGLTREGASHTSQILRYVNVHVVSIQECKESYSWVGKGQLCAGEARGGKDACQGDSGGPLWIQRREVKYLVGVVSSGRGCARPRTPGIYTSIPNYFSWILETMSSKSF